MTEAVQTTEPTTTPTTPAAPAPAPTEPPAAAAAPAAPEFVPLTAEALAFPEGTTVHEPTRDRFLEIVNNQELSPADRANQLIALQHEFAQTAVTEWANQQQAWQDEVRADPEIGGAKLDTTLAGIGKVIDQFGTPELRQVMDVTGAGNNIHVVRFLAKVAAVLPEGTPVSGTPTGERSVASLLYPTMEK